MKDYTTEEYVLAVALWDSENTSRLSEQSEETNKKYLRKASVTLAWLNALGYDLVQVDKIEAPNDD